MQKSNSFFIYESSHHSFCGQSIYSQLLDIVVYENVYVEWLEKIANSGEMYK